MKKTLALILALCLCMVATAAFAAAPAPGEQAGFTEYPIGDDQEYSWDENNTINIAAVYFQPVEMLPAMGQSVEDSDIHLEADISIGNNNIGFGVGDWIPYMTVDYAITSEDGTVAAEGTFMEMNASDGPHYGANIALPNADTYTLTLTLHSPVENNYMLHVDAETGVEGRFWEEPIVITFEGWDYIPQEW